MKTLLTIALLLSSTAHAEQAFTVVPPNRAVTIAGDTFRLAGIQSEFYYGPPLSAVGCWVNPAIDKSASAFLVKPDYSQALILSFENVDPLPDDTWLYQCDIAMDPGAVPGNYPIWCGASAGSDPGGNVEFVGCLDGLTAKAHRDTRW